MHPLIAFALTFTLIGIGAGAKAQASHFTYCGPSSSQLKSCKWHKELGARLAGKDGYIIKYSDGVQWWLPNGTGQCRFFNTYFKNKDEKWRAVQATCTAEGLIEIRELNGKILHVATIEG